MQIDTEITIGGHKLQLSFEKMYIIFDDEIIRFELQHNKIKCVEIEGNQKGRKAFLRRRNNTEFYDKIVNAYKEWEFNKTMKELLTEKE